MTKLLNQNSLGRVTVNMVCQRVRIWSHLGDKALGLPVRDYLVYTSVMLVGDCLDYTPVGRSTMNVDGTIPCPRVLSCTKRKELCQLSTGVHLPLLPGCGYSVTSHPKFLCP